MYAEIKDYPNYIAYDKGLIYSVRKTNKIFKNYYWKFK